MAGHARFTAVLDACVIYPHAVIDSLLSLAAADLFAPKWTQHIEQEWISALETDREDLRGGKLYRRRDAMRLAVPDWEVPEDAWQPIAANLTLPDPKDVHVLAAAIAAHADCIVTTNTRHYPAAALSPFGLEVIDPDVFLINQLDLSPISALTAFKAMRGRRKNPSMNAEEFAASLERSGLPTTAQRLREAANLL
jgi:predicted nucleic acid-binding protein